MSMEEAICFPCAGEDLIGILHRPAEPRDVGMVIIVGGPQYRVGSHRQFTLLARHLEREGFAVLRFDCRGMGDSSGEFPGFEHIGPDIAAAVDTLCRQVPAVRRVALWGLCDGASAALMYAPTDTRIAGMALANPWVRAQATLARSYLRHYYIERLLSGDFWRKLLGGRLRPGKALGDLAGNVRVGSGKVPVENGFIARMRNGLASFVHPVLILLSGQDMTAAEFSGLAATPAWRRLLERPGITRCSIEAATHTFASAEWRDEAARITARWLDSLSPATGSRVG